ncbi:MAG: DNA polymerase [Phenylobacterium sp.]
MHIPAVHARSQAERAFGDRAAINAPLQGASADIIRRAMIRMPGELAAAGLKTRMLLQVHDELIFEAPWRGALMAARSPKARSAWLRAWTAGMCTRRPNRVVT